jgi:hypothetical protein
MRARILIRTTIATLAIAAVVAAPAGAHLTRFDTSFTATGLVNPTYDAVNQTTHNVYVVGSVSAGLAVQEFSASGVPVTSFVSPRLYAPRGIAVDNSGGPSEGDVYVTSGDEGKVIKLEPSGGEVPGFTPITASAIPHGEVGSEGFVPEKVAVDSSNGNVVVIDVRHHEVDIFSASGVFVTQFAVSPDSSVASGVAIGSVGEIFTTGPEGAQAWSPADGYSVPTQISSASAEFAYGIAFDASSGHLLVSETEEPREIYEYEGSGAYTLLQKFGSGLFEYASGLAVDEATDTIYVPVPVLGTVEVFGPAVEVAEVLTGSPATGVTSTSADVSGTVDPEGATATGCSFEYGLSTSYGYTSPCSPSVPLSGNTVIPVAASLEGLQPGETYHYRLVGRTAGGPSYGEDETFQTPPASPTIQNESVSALTQTSATLDALINPNNQETTYHFEYGLTSAYGTVLPAPDAGIGSAYGNLAVGAELSGLQAGTTYHFRVVATNASSPPGGTPGPDQTFTTPPPEPPVVSTGQAVGVAQNSATLTGTVETQGFQTEYQFDIGTDTGYGTRVFGDASSEVGMHTFAVALQGLMPGTTYHYRIAATNTFGTTYGVDVTFTTGTYPSATLTAPVSEPFVPAILLAAAPSASAAKAAGIKPAAARTARYTKARRRSRGRGGYRRKGRARGAVHAHGDNRGKVGR